MPRNYVPNTGSRKYGYSEEALNSAIIDVKNGIVSKLTTRYLHICMGVLSSVKYKIAKRTSGYLQLARKKHSWTKL